MKLGPNQIKILKALEKGKMNLDELVNETNIDLFTIKNIINEFYEATVVKKQENYYFLNEDEPKHHGKFNEKSQWDDIKNSFPKLKNLSRIV